MVRLQNIFVAALLWCAQPNLFGPASTSKQMVALARAPGKNTAKPVALATKKSQAPVTVGTFEESKGDPLNSTNPYFQKVLPEDFCLATNNKEINLGSIVPMTGAVSLVGQDVAYGMDLVFNKFNSQGGIAGNLIKIKTLDSQNENTVARDQLNVLWQSTSLFLGIFDAELISNSLPQVKDKKFCLLFPSCGIDSVRRAGAKFLLNFRASINQEIEALLTYSVTKLLRRKIAILYEDSIWGTAGLEHAEKVLQTLGYSIIAKASYSQNTVEISSAVAKIADQSPSVILCLAQAWPTHTFITQAIRKALKNCYFLCLGECAPIQEILLARGIKNVITSSVVPSPFTSKLPLAEQFRQDVNKFYANKSMSQFFFEGYCIASLFAQALTSLQAPFKLQDVLTYFEQLKNFDFHGLTLDFSPKTNTLSHNVWINLGKDKEWPVFKTTV